MQSPSPKWWPVLTLMIIGLMAVGGMTLPGCSQGPEESTTPEDESPAKPGQGPLEPGPTEPSPEPGPAEPLPVPGAPEPPVPPGISSFAPAEDLVSQVDYYVEGLSEAVASEEEYNDLVEKIAKDANTLVVIALGLGLHDQDNKYRGIAAVLMKQAQELAAAEDFASAKASVAAVVGTVRDLSSPPAAEMKWEKVASLEQLMKQVPLINTKLKRYAKGRRFESKAKDTAGYSAVIAIIAQGALADTDEAKNAEEVQQWYDFCVQMREAAGKVNAAIHDLDEEAAATAMQELQQSCDDCHAVFHPDEPPVASGEGETLGRNAVR